MYTVQIAFFMAYVAARDFVNYIGNIKCIKIINSHIYKWPQQWKYLLKVKNGGLGLGGWYLVNFLYLNRGVDRKLYAWWNDRILVENHVIYLKYLRA